jgi:sec-independent protein translocase protein TatB
MFDIGFAELLVVGVISLVVLGPERLPGAMRTTGLWVGRIRRSIREIKTDIEREVGADEIRRQLHNEEVMRSLEKMDRAKSDVYSLADDFLNDATNFGIRESDEAFYSDEEKDAIAKGRAKREAEIKAADEKPMPAAPVQPASTEQKDAGK